MGLILILPALAALLNRWRGGSWPFLPGEIHGGPSDHKRTQVRRIAWALGIGIMAWNPWLGVVAFLSCLTGWGFPVSAAINSKSARFFPEPEFKPFDWLAYKLMFGSYNRTAYGVVWLTLHGLTFGALAALATGSLWYFGLATMGLSYWAAKDWERGELIFGAVWGTLIAISILQ